MQIYLKFSLQGEPCLRPSLNWLCSRLLNITTNTTVLAYIMCSQFHQIAHSHLDIHNRIQQDLQALRRPMNKHEAQSHGFATAGVYLIQQENQWGLGKGRGNTNPNPNLSNLHTLDFRLIYFQIEIPDIPQLPQYAICIPLLFFM